MDAQRWAAIEPLFHAALGKEPEGRAAFLANACGADTSLREEVESLVAFAGTDLESPARREELEELWGRAVDSQAGATPTRIGRYRIARLVDEGGMGAVYEAEQDQPRRTVALKVVKCGFSSPDLFRRFETEFQALGRLQHPGIAQIYEAGTADSGFGPQPYFAMEFIRGDPLTRYAETHSLSLRQRLEIMAKVCQAVHHAHQRGIIHRDLKPANILVDQTGQPKILDFGVARLTDSGTQVTQQTDFGRLMGTLDYMSPEQTLTDPLEIDTRSDVYSLGVILYEILVGRLPYQASPQLAATLHTIREEEPAPLSSVSRVYRGDIEIIAGKALEKDKTRRYSSAAELAADIERHLHDEPIAACRPSTVYQVRKFARRHKGLVVGAAAVLLALVGGIVASTWEAARARRAEQTAEAVSEFLQEDLLAQAGSLAQSSSGARADPDLKVRTALNRAADGIGARFASQPLVEASIRETIGEAYLDLGLFFEAQKQCERALDLRRRVLGPDDRSTLTSARTLAIAYGQQGHSAAAETLFQNTLAGQRRVLGSRHPETLYTMQQLALLHERQGTLAEAWPIVQEYVEGARGVYGETAPQTLAGLETEGEILSTRGKYADAEALLTQVVEDRRRLLGEDNLETADSLSMLAVNYGREGKFAEGAQALEKALEVQRRQLGPQHDRTLDSMVVLAWLYQEQGRYRQAENLTLKSMEAQRLISGRDLPYLRGSVHRLASLYREEGRYAEAEALNTKALEFWRGAWGVPGKSRA